MYRIKHYKSVTSTNKKAKEEHLTHGSVIIADKQTQGYGRYGRKWHSPEGNIYMTIVLKPTLPLSKWPQISYIAGVAVAETIKRTNHLIQPQLKWVNDILINNKKVGGVLLEAQDADFLLVGIGVNLIHTVDLKNLNATSIDIYAEIDKKKFIDILLQQFELYYNMWLEKEFLPIKGAWMRFAIGVGRQIVVRYHNAKEEGIFIDIDNQGRLHLLQDNHMKIVNAGELFFYNEI